MHLSRRRFLQGMALAPVLRQRAEDPGNWPAFRGPHGRGVADGFSVRESWNADEIPSKPDGVLWRTEVPGLGHSSPVLWGDRLFVPTAIASEGRVPLQLGGDAGVNRTDWTGGTAAAEDKGEQRWVVLCFDKQSGREVWRQTARTGRPQATRHSKATHANTSLATDGDRLVAFFGSEGLYCYDLDGRLLWSRDLGIINISKYGVGRGFGSSPAIHEDRIALLCDDPENPFLVVLNLSDGREIWRVFRKGVSEASWGTPLIHAGPKGAQVVTNGWPWVVSYDLETGEELWRLGGGGDNPIPSPFVANGWIYITSAHGSESPIFVVDPDARGDITPAPRSRESDSMLWHASRGGSYVSTPVVYRGYIYFGYETGVVRCFDAKTGKRMYEKRLDPGAAIAASLVAADGKVFCPSENGTVYVIEAGPTFNLLARNSMGEPCFATPAISGGTLYFRTPASLIAIG
jgi:outer membrane protein assembly factor BamB